MNAIDFFSQIARYKAAALRYKRKETAMKTLATLIFGAPEEPINNQTTFAGWNLTMDSCGQLGRLAQSAAIVEEEFPGTRLEFGRIQEDILKTAKDPTKDTAPKETAGTSESPIQVSENNSPIKDMLCDDLPAPAEKPTENGDELLQDFLVYEEPLSALMVDGQPFFPLAQESGNGDYRRIDCFPFWEAITAGALVALAWTEKVEEKKLEIVEEAIRLSASVTLTAEKIAEQPDFVNYSGRDPQKRLRWVRKKEASVQSLFLIIREREHLDELLKRYPRNIKNDL